MDTAFLTLQKVPAISKQELLLYIAGQPNPVLVKISTRAGFVYNGYVANIGTVKEEGAVLVLEVLTDKNQPTGRFLHLALASIEAVELQNEAAAISLFSLGTMAPAQHYSVSGKLEILRAFKAFDDTIYAAYGLHTGVPQMELPEEGLALNRIGKLTAIILQVVLDLLKAADAQTSWQKKYNSIVFVNKGDLQVEDQSPALHIHFPFTAIETPEIVAKELNRLLLAVL